MAENTQVVGSQARRWYARHVHVVHRCALAVSHRMVPMSPPHNARGGARHLKAMGALKSLRGPGVFCNFFFFLYLLRMKREQLRFADPTNGWIFLV